MPYKRYDLKNRYNRRGRRVSNRAWVSTLWLILIPLIIAGVVILGILLPIKSETNSRPSAETSVTESDEIPETISDDILLMIVNENYPIPEDYDPELESYAGVEVSSIITRDLDNLIRDAKAEGIDISLSEGYVSFEEQTKRYNDVFEKLKKDKGYSEVKAESETKKICPEAGCSESQTGLLLTFKTSENGDFSQTKAGKWLIKYSVNYGFVLRYPEGEEEVTGRVYDPATYRYVGIENAKKMRSYAMTLEAYETHVNSK